MPDYLVEWSIEIIADTPEEAAREALKIQRDPDSRANVFDVIPADGSGEAVRVDIEELDQKVRVTLDGQEMLVTEDEYEDLRKAGVLYYETH